MLIDRRGWGRGDILIEETARQIDIVYGKGQRRPTGRTDYLLCRPLAEGTARIPLAILEAKHEGKPPEHGLQQGKGYRIGKLHHVPFVFSSNGHQFVETTTPRARLPTRDRWPNFRGPRNSWRGISRRADSRPRRRRWRCSPRRTRRGAARCVTIRTRRFARRASNSSGRSTREKRRA